jgi:peptide/nickel transport system ATP-binding protein
MNGAKPPILELRDITRTFTVRRGLFRGKQPLYAVRGVSLRIDKEDVLGLVGESGCGKSTVAMMLLGLLPVTGGHIQMDGKDITGWDRKAIARRIQPIFQDPYSSLNPRQTIGQIVSLPLRVHRIGSSSERRAKTEEILDMVGLPRRSYNSYPNQLSGGQRQRVAVARALVMKPEVVICDEPTSSLDVSVQSQILNLLLDFRKELGLTYMLISHNLAVVEHMATRVAVMYLGRIVEEGETDQIFRTPRHPYTKALLASVMVPQPGRKIPDTHLGLAFPNPLELPPGCTFHPRCPQAADRCRTEAPGPMPVEGGYVECHLFGPPGAHPEGPVSVEGVSAQ